MGRVLITTSVPQQATAWTKARQDVLHVLRQAGFATLVLPDGTNPLRWLAFASRMRRLAGDGGQVLIEYPFEHRRRAYLLRWLAQLGGMRLHALVHDLDSLRHADSPASREIAILKLFDGLISHNPTMTSWLREQGVTAKIVNLNLFDYCSPPSAAWHEAGMASPMKVVCAGNLSYPKARYLYDPQLGELEGVELSLFGAFFEPDRMPSSFVKYKGVFQPDQPQLDQTYHFGLIWDGTGVDGCRGNYGDYMRYNNPHKLSLYMALGLPVIVWEEAAIARYVVGRGVGVLVRDLRELGGIARSIGSTDYLKMAANATRLGERARRGEFLREAVGQLLR